MLRLFELSFCICQMPQFTHLSRFLSEVLSLVAGIGPVLQVLSRSYSPHFSLTPRAVTYAPKPQLSYLEHRGGLLPRAAVKAKVGPPQSPRAPEVLRQGLWGADPALGSIHSSLGSPPGQFSWLLDYQALRK